MSSLFEAVASGDPEAVVVALEAGDDVNALGEGGTTPLIQAAKLGHADLVELLLEAGAVAFLKDDEQETALLKAAANGHHEVPGSARVGRAGGVHRRRLRFRR